MSSSSSNGNFPDIDPANNGSLAGTMQFAFYKMMQSMNGMLPAKVIKYDRTANRVQVQILLSQITTTNQIVSRPQIASLPVLILGGGGFMLNFNLNPGDFGWVMANDRDISLFLQTYDETPPNTNRIKNFADSLFIPDVMTGYTIDTLDASNAVLQSTDGTVKISLGTGKITISAPVVEIDGFTSGTINAITPTGGTLTVTGNLHVTGTIINP